MQTALDFRRCVMDNVGDVIVGKGEVIEHLISLYYAKGTSCWRMCRASARR